MGAVITRRGRDTRVTHTEKRPCEDTVKRQPAASQGERPEEKTSLPVS